MECRASVEPNVAGSTLPVESLNMIHLQVASANRGDLKKATVINLNAVVRGSCGVASPAISSVFLEVSMARVTWTLVSLERSV